MDDIEGRVEGMEVERGEGNEVRREGRGGRVREVE